MSEPVDFEAVPQDDPDAQACLARYYDELAERFDFDVATSLHTDPDEVTPPNGVFLLGRRAGEAVACGALRTLEPGVGEIKRMWVAGEARGSGVGRRLLEALEARARGFGHHTVRLDSNVVLTEAFSLYRSSGYAEIDRYNDDPHPTHFFEKQLLTT